MRPHPDFADADLPRNIAIGDVCLTPLAPEFVDEDFDAVMAAAPLIEGILGDWPAGLTRASNLIDLAWHEREFTARRSFAWILRNAAGQYIGCFYIFPDIGRRGHAEAILWLCDIPDRDLVAATLKDALSAWLAQALRPEIELAWRTRPILGRTFP